MSFETDVHYVKLTGNEISTILYALEGYIQGNDEYESGGDFSLDVDNIFSALEAVTDNYYYEKEKFNISNGVRCFVDEQQVNCTTWEQ